jgi:hypothetical protein
MARSEYDPEAPEREIPDDPGEHRSQVEVERFAAELEDFAVNTMLVNVKAAYETRDGRRYIVEFEHNGEATDKPTIKKVDL